MFSDLLQGSYNQMMDDINARIQGNVLVLKADIVPYLTASVTLTAIAVILLVLVLIKQGQAMGTIQKLIIENRKLHEQLASKGVRMNERTYE